MSVRWRLLRAPLALLYRMLQKLCQMLCGIKLDYTVLVDRKAKIEHFGGMILGARQIGNGVIIRPNTILGIRHPADLNAKPTIEDDVEIGAGAVIVGDITIGRGSFIGANSVVYFDVPPHSRVVGNPAKIITKKRVSESASLGFIIVAFSTWRYILHYDRANKERLLACCLANHRQLKELRGEAFYFAV
jgi:serine acetyltransferase